MRIGSDILVQRIDHDHVVIVQYGEEIVISEDVAARLLPAMQYFFPALFVDIAPLDTEVPL